MVLGVVAIGMGTFTLKSQQVVFGDRAPIDRRVVHLHGLLRVIAGLITLAGVAFNSLEMVSLGTLGIVFGGGVTVVAQVIVDRFAR